MRSLLVLAGCLALKARCTCIQQEIAAATRRQLMDQQLCWQQHTCVIEWECRVTCHCQLLGNCERT